LSSAHPTWLVALLAPVALVLAGCAVFDRVDYPEGWGGSAPAVLANGCPDLSGTYDTRPTDTYPASLSTSPTLNEILGPGGLSDVYGRDKPWPALPGATRATLTSDGDWPLSLRIRASAKRPDFARRGDRNGPNAVVEHVDVRPIAHMH